jgi:hypothetical protein
MKIVAGIWPNRRRLLVGKMRIFGRGLLVEEVSMKLSVKMAVSF